MKVCDKTCIFFFFPIINKYFLMAKRSLLSRCPSYMQIERSGRYQYLLSATLIKYANQTVEQCVKLSVQWGQTGMTIVHYKLIMYHKEWGGRADSTET